jgi:hypothetical protein
MTYRSRRRATFPWGTVAGFLGGVLLGMFLLAPLVQPVRDACPECPATVSDVSSLDPLGEPTPVQAREPSPTFALGPTVGPTPVTPTDPMSAPATTVTPTAEPVPATVPAVQAAAEATAVAPSAEARDLTRAEIEASVIDAVVRFQEAKEYAQRTGDGSRLSEALMGPALERQTQLVNQTKAANCYWEIALDEPMRYAFLEVRDDTYVQVRVSKVETRRQYCNGRLASEALRDAYDATYDVQRVDDTWYIGSRP